MKLPTGILHGDIVNKKCEFLRRNDMQNMRLYVGVLEIQRGVSAGRTPRGDMLWYFRPWDNKRVTPFVVARRFGPGETVHNLIVGVKFESWVSGTKYPRGVIEVVFGCVGNMNAE